MAKGNGEFEFDLNLKPLISSLPELDRRTDRGVAGVMEYWDSRIESHMKVLAPWTDRTGNARQGLYAKAGHDPFKSHWITLGYRVPYGIWLEVRFAGRYSIVIPSLVIYGPKIMQSMNKLFARLGAI